MEIEEDCGKIVFIGIDICQEFDKVNSNSFYFFNSQNNKRGFKSDYINQNIHLSQLVILISESKSFNVVRSSHDISHNLTIIKVKWIISIKIMFVLVFINNCRLTNLEKQFGILNILKHITTKQQKSGDIILIFNQDFNKMLYKSLQQTIQEYEKRKKQTQSEGDRKIFKWKVFALGFCILVIVLIGILSQLIQTFEEDESENHNFTFLPTLLQQSNELDKIVSIKNFLNGFSKSSRIMYDKSQKLLDTSFMKSQQLISKIKGRRNILFLFKLQEQIHKQQPPNIYRFGMLLKNQYDQQTDPENGLINIFDNTEDLSSVYFNLNQAQAIRLNLKPGCRLYSFNETNGSLLLMESIHFANNSPDAQINKIHFGITRQQCFGINGAEALNQLKRVTGIQLTSLEQIKELQILKIQVFYLTLNGKNVQ